MTHPLRSLYEPGVAALAAAGVPSPQADVELLIGSVLGVSRGRVQTLLVMDGPIGDEESERVETMIARRAQREPLQHITGRAAFRGLELAVGPGVFVPRPETETVAQHAVDALRATAASEPIAVDLGTGSGAIGLSLAHEVPHARVWAVERSPQAYRWAERNRAELALDGIQLVCDDFASALEELDGRVDVVVSNPPYVPDEAVPADPEVHLFDPAEALYSGADGLDDVRTIAQVARRLLRPGGTVVLEHGERQGAAVRGILSSSGFRAAATHPDLTTRDRATTAVRDPDDSLG